MLLNFLLVGAVLILAAALVRTREPRLRRYLWSELIATVAITLAGSDWYGWRYTLTFCAARTLDLSCAIWLSHPRMGTTLAAIFITAIAWLGIRGPLDLNTTIALLEGCGFAVAGISMALQKSSYVNAALTILWLLLAWFNLGYAMNWHLDAWQELAGYWNTLVFDFAFIVVAVFAERKIQGGNNG